MTRRTTRVAGLAVALAVALTGSGSLTSASAHDPYSDDPDAQAEAFARMVPSPAASASSAATSDARCQNGEAASRGTTFSCRGINLMSWLDFEDLSDPAPASPHQVTLVNDMWGWSAEGRDFALVGSAQGTIFVDISTPKAPIVLGMLPTRSLVGASDWRDIKVYNDYAYIVSEHESHGVQVFDLRNLVTAPTDSYTIFEATGLGYDGPPAQLVGSSHNININEATGFAYVVGSASCNGGLHMINLADPAEPEFAGCYGRDGYIHDTQCVVYAGPDTKYRGREICVISNAVERPLWMGRLNRITIVDVTKKKNPERISKVRYSSDGYSHQGWLTDDQRTFLHGDELDELEGAVGKTTTRIWNVSNLDRPKLVGAYRKTRAIDHNVYTEGRYAYSSNYHAGLRVLDLKRVQKGRLSQAGFFDVYPEDNRSDFEGTWSNYPYFSKRGVVGVSSIDRGFFVVKLKKGLLAPKSVGRAAPQALALGMLGAQEGAEVGHRKGNRPALS